MCRKHLSLLLIIAAFLVAGSAVTLSAAALGPIACWKLDDATGTVASDSSGNGNNGILMEGPGVGSTAEGAEGHGPNWVAGKVGGALSFDGVNDYVNLAPTNSGLPTLLAALTNSTFTAWANFQHIGGNWQRIWELSDSGSNVMFLTPCQGTSGPMRFGINAAGGAEQLVDASTGTLASGWHHVTITIKQVTAGQSTYTMYLDGVQVGQNANGTLTPSRAVGTAAFTRCWLARPRWQSDSYYSGSIDDFEIFDKVLLPSEIQTVMLGDAGAAFNPRPEDGATDVVQDTVLGWTPGQFAHTHDVYFGTVFDDVNSAGRADPKGVLMAQGQDANTYTPTSLLELGQTYYWRVDEVNAPPTSATIFKGRTWSFTAEPVGYPITNITATASSFGAATGPQNTIDGSGLTGNLHSTDSKAMWLSTAAVQSAWIRYDFDRVYKLHELWVWNQNTAYESFLGFGAKDTVIEYSPDGTNWTKLGDFQFAQASGTDDYAHNTTVSFGGITAKSVRITISSSWISKKQTGLSEVRFFYIPASARNPDPASGSTNVSPSVTLSWRPGRGATSHNVYLGTDSNTVKAGTVAFGTTSTPSYAPPALQLGTTYYWKVDEIDAGTAWSSDVWSFSTPEYVLVDDMESYDNNTGTRIFDTWVDGWGTSDNGSQVGYSTSPFAERSIVHAGAQSMPLAYDNTAGRTNSEATRTFESTRNWTEGGIKTLVVYFRGDPANTTGQLFAKINNTKVNYSGNAAVMSSIIWKQWNIDLTAIGGLAAVKTLTIGVSGSGKGTLYIDDIRLYKSAPAVVSPADPGTSGLLAYFTMEGEVKDVSGHGYTGVLTGITFLDSMTGFGKAAQFNGTTGYVDLGASFGSGLIKSLTNGTATAWVNYTGAGNTWQRVFDFGSSTTVYMFLCTRNGSNYPRFAIMGSGKAEVGASDSRVMSTGWHHLAGVVNASTMTVALYVDGSLAQGNVATTVLPKDLGATTNNWLGRSQFTADPYLNGALDDVRIYNRPLTAGEISYLAGDR
jgi:hypothetical protein